MRHAGYFRLEALVTQDVIAICGSTNFSDEVQVSAFVKQASVIGKTRYLILTERRAFCVRCQPVSARTLTSRADHVFAAMVLFPGLLRSFNHWFRQLKPQGRDHEVCINFFQNKGIFDTEKRIKLAFACLLTSVRNAADLSWR